MTLKQLMTKLGIAVYSGMPASKFVKAVVAAPVLVTSFPSLSSLATTINTMIGTYEGLQEQLTSLQNTITTQEETIDSLQSGMNNAQIVYSYFVSGGETGTPPYFGELAGNLVTIHSEPASIKAQYATLTAAQESLEEAKSTLKSLKAQLASLQETVSNYYNYIDAQVATYVDSIINTKVL